MREVPQTAPRMPCDRGCSGGEDGLQLELEAEPGAGISESGIVCGEVHVRYVVEKPRDAEVGYQLVAEFEAVTREQPTISGRGRADGAEHPRWGERQLEIAARLGFDVDD